MVPPPPPASPLPVPPTSSLKEVALITVQKLFTEHGTITRDVDSGDSVFEIYVKAIYPLYKSISGMNGIDVDIIHGNNQGDISLENYSQFSLMGLRIFVFYF